MFANFCLNKEHYLVLVTLLSQVIILDAGALEAYIREKIVSEGGEVVGKEDKGQDEEFIGDALKGVPGNSDDDENRSVINDGNEDLLTEAHEGQADAQESRFRGPERHDRRFRR